MQLLLCSLNFSNQVAFSLSFCVVGVLEVRGSCDGDDGWLKKWIFIYQCKESRHSLSSFSLFFSVKTISKLNVEHNVKFEIYMLKLDDEVPTT